MADKVIIRKNELDTLIKKPSFAPFLGGIIPSDITGICPYCMTRHSELQTCGATETAVYVGRDCESEIDYYLDED